MELGHDQAVQIVRFDTEGEKAFLNDKKLATILSRREDIEKMPTIVISIGGIARSGKSFLLNLFVSYLSYLGENGSDRGWDVSELPITGVNWARNGTAVTFGIWMWNKPFVITRSDGSKAAVLLMDSQGTGDNSLGSVTVNTLIMYISLQISSVQVLNIRAYLTSSEMTSLQLCADYADVEDVDQELEREDEYLFQSLMFVIRDCQSADEFGEDPVQFQQIVKDVQSRELKSVVLGISKAFRSISTYVFPHPGPDITKASSTSQLLPKDVPKKFLETTRELIRDLCSLKETDVAVKQRRCWLSPRELLINFKMLKSHMEDDNLPPITNSSDALQETILYRAYVAAQTEFAIDVQKFTDDWIITFSTEIMLREDFETVTRKAQEIFRKVGKHRKYSESGIWRKYKGMLDDLLETKYSVIKKDYGTQKRLHQLQASQETLRRQLDQQTNEFHQRLAEVNEKMRKAEQEHIVAAQMASDIMGGLRAKLTKDGKSEAEIKIKFEQYEKINRERKQNAAREIERANKNKEEIMAELLNMRTTFDEAMQKLQVKVEEESRKSKIAEEKYNKSIAFSPAAALFDIAAGAALGSQIGGLPGAAGGAVYGGVSYGVHYYMGK